MNKGVELAMIKNIEAIQFNTQWGEGRYKVQFYSNGRFAIKAISTADEYDAPFYILTVNIPDAEIEDDEVIVKTWSENTEPAKQAMATGLFIDTGRRIPTGFVEAQVWKVL